MAFKVKDLMTKIVPGTSPGPRIWACPDDTNPEHPCPEDSRGQCPEDSRGNCGHTWCPEDTNITNCPDDTNPPNCPEDTNPPCMGHTRPPHHPYQAAGRGGEALALLQRQLRERLDSVAEARI